jgi:hypothetical protein
MSNLKAKLLVEVNIGDVKKRYPNFQFNYINKEDFLRNNIISELEHIADEQEYDAGYETVVANTMLDCMDSFISIGDKVMYIENNKPVFGIVKDIVWENDTEYCHIVSNSSEQDTKKRNMPVAVEMNNVITIYDFLQEI